MHGRFNESVNSIIEEELRSEQDNESGEKEKNLEKCPILDIPPYTDCANEKQRNLWIRVNQYATEASDQFKEKLDTILESYRYGGKVGIGNDIKSYLTQNGLLYPDFKFRFGNEGYNYLEEIALENRIKSVGENEGILMFQLPSNLAKFWWKYTEESNFSALRDYNKYPAADLNDMVIEWGKIYGMVMPAVWKVVNDFNQEGDTKFKRLNNLGEHSPKEYYYVWAVS